MTKQINKYGQSVTIRLDMANGEQAQPGIYLARLLKTQDFEAWKQSPAEFRDWIAEQMANYFKSLNVVIMTK